MAYLYRHIRLDKSEPFYIGISNNSNNKYRAVGKSSRNKIWKSIVNKSEYKVEIVFDDITWEEACKKEKEFINLYGKIINQTGTLCNLTDGGDGTIGFPSWNKGIKGIIKSTQSTKDKISLAHKGRVLSDIHKFRIGIANKNMSDETRKKLSDINKGNKNFLGKKHKESSKLLNAYKKGARILDSDNCLCHIGVTSAALFLNMSPSTLRNQMSGFRKKKVTLEYIKNQKMSELKK